MFKHAHMHTRVRRLKQEDHKFKASLNYTAQSHLKRGQEWVRGGGNALYFLHVFIYHFLVVQKRKEM